MSVRRNRRCPPGVRIAVMRPRFSQLRTVLTATPNDLATSPIAMSALGVSVVMTRDSSYNYSKLSNTLVSGVLCTGKLAWDGTGPFEMPELNQELA